MQTLCVAKPCQPSPIKYSKLRRENLEILVSIQTPQNECMPVQTVDTCAMMNGSDWRFRVHINIHTIAHTSACGGRVLSDASNGLLVKSNLLQNEWLCCGSLCTSRTHPHTYKHTHTIRVSSIRRLHSIPLPIGVTVPRRSMSQCWYYRRVLKTYTGELATILI